MRDALNLLRQVRNNNTGEYSLKTTEKYQTEQNSNKDIVWTLLFSAAL